MDLEEIRSVCEQAYGRFHSPDFIRPDPLQVVLDQEVEDREVSAFIVSCVSMGRVDGILKAAGNLVSRIRNIFGEGISSTLLKATDSELEQAVRGFVYRFFVEQDIFRLLKAISLTLRRYGSLEACARAEQVGGSEQKARVLLSAIRVSLHGAVGGLHPMLISDPSGPGASKRLHLFLRWMVRRDVIDPGGWTILSPAELLIPMDTHMLRHCRRMGMTSRRVGDLRASLEASAVFAKVLPEDPCRYDFSLSRMGINPSATDLTDHVYEEGQILSESRGD